jgi:hypothetical protein
MNAMSKNEPTVNVELTIGEAQELESTLRIMVKKIDWILENNPPKKAGEADKMDTRAKKLTLIAAKIAKLLNDRVLAASNVK